MEPQKKPLTGRARENQIPRCPLCRAKTLQGEEKCRSCGFPNQANVEEQRAYIKIYRDLVGRWKKADGRMKQAASLLLFIGFFSIFGTLGSIAYMINSSGVESLTEGLLIFMLSLFGTVTFIITGFLARKFGLVPLVIGTCCYGLFFLVSILMDPWNLFGIVRIIFLISLIIGTIAAAKSTKIKLEIEQKLGEKYLKRLLDKNQD